MLGTVSYDVTLYKGACIIEAPFFIRLIVIAVLVCDRVQRDAQHFVSLTTVVK